MNHLTTPSPRASFGRETPGFSEEPGSGFWNDVSEEDGELQRGFLGRWVLLIWLIGVFVVASPLRRLHVVSPGGILTSLLLSVPTVATFLVLVLRSSNPQPEGSRCYSGILPWCLFMGIALLSTLIGHHRPEAFGHLFALGLVIVNATLLRHHLRAEDVRWALAAYGVVFISIAFPLSVRSLLSGSRFGAAELGLNANSVGHMALGATVGVTLLPNPKTRLVLLAASLWVIFSTGSRGALLSFSVFGSIMLARAINRTPGKACFAALVLCIMLAMGLAFTPGWFTKVGRFLEDRLAILDPDRGFRHGLDIGRRQSNRLLWAMFLSAPIQGLGYRIEDFVLPQLSTVGSHNGYLSQLAGSGILGAAFTVWIIFRATARFMRAGDHVSTTLLAFTWGFLAAATVERFLFNTGNPTGILFIFALVYSGAVKPEDSAAFSEGSAEDER